MTERAAGFCAGFGAPGFANPWVGRGRGIGLGRGRFARGGGHGFRHWFYAPGMPGWMRFAGYAAPYVGEYLASRLKPDPELEKQALKKEVEALQAELEFLKQRLAELETSAETK